jgi:signal transduction histidine kinase
MSEAGGKGAAVIYADRMAGKFVADAPPYSAALRRTTVAACAVLFALILIGAVRDMPSQSPPALAATSAALIAGLTGISWHIATGPRGVRSLVTLAVAGLAGVALVPLLPNAAGYLVVFIALLALGMDLPPVPAAAAGLVIFAAANIAAATWSRLNVANLVSNDAGGAFLFTVGVFIRSTRLAQARASAAQARAERLLAQLRDAQAAEAKAAILTERTRLAREVHDILAHSLSGLVLALDTAELLGRRGTADPGTQEQILRQVTRAQRMARDGLADTRRAVAALRGDELPGPALLGRLVRDTAETAGLHAVLTVTGEPRPLAPEAGLALYRTAQEALINSAKYAGRGGTAELRLTYRRADVLLEVEDVRAPGGDAAGPAGLTFGGYGLAGMRERAELLGGDLTAGPTTAGFRVALRLPAAEETA